MTNNKADSGHSSTTSFGNYLVRIPGSFNTKYIRFNKAQSEAKIVQRWNGYKPDIKWVLRDYWIDLTQEKNNEILATSHRDQRRLLYQWKSGIDPN